jgi:uncharacterized protein (DUF58 family)
MIVPSNRQIFWLALFLPFAAAWTLVPAMSRVAPAMFIVLLATTLVDAVLSRSVVRSIQLTLPEMLRLSKDKAGRIPIHIANSTEKPMTLRVGLPLPPEIQCEQDLLTVALPLGSPAALAELPCTPTARGRYAIDRCYFEVPSTLGLWKMRGTSKSSSEIRVYPNLMKERKHLAALFLNRGNFGVHRQRMIGQGRDFEKLREYIPGDSYDDIHWKATAKRGRPVTKLFQIERTQEIYVAIDASRLSARPAGEEPALERFLNAALVLGLAAERQGDLFGVVSFSNRVKRFIRAGKGRAHFNTCRDALYMLKPQITSPDFEELCSFVRLRMRRRALLIILTDLGDPQLAKTFLRNIDLISRHHLVMVCMLRPAAANPLFSEADANDTDDLYRRLGGHITWQRLRELTRGLQRKGVRLSLVDDEALSAELVKQYLNIKARQML